MINFSIRAISPSGQVVFLRRKAVSEDEAALDIMREGLIPVSISAKEGIMEVLSRPILLPRKIRTSDIALFCEQMSAMTGSGLTVEQALRVLTKQNAKRPITKMATRLLPRVQEGHSLSVGLAAEPELPRYVSGMINASEAGGRLAEGLEEAGRYLQRQAQTRENLINALTYPFVVLMTVFIALLLILSLVIPAFAPIFAGEEHRLPSITRFVLNLSNLLVNHTIELTLAISITIIVTILTWRKSQSIRQIIFHLAEKTPPFKLTKRLELARALGVMAMLFRNGVEISEAVALAAQSTSSTYLGNMLEGAARQLREGTSITTALRRIPEIPDDTRALLEIGEHTGDLGSTAHRAAQLLEADTAHQIERLIALANPISIVFLGIVIGLVVGGVMLGVLSINQLSVRS